MSGPGGLAAKRLSWAVSGFAATHRADAPLSASRLLPPSLVGLVACPEDVVGWSVVLHATGALLGRVLEVIVLGDARQALVRVGIPAPAVTPSAGEDETEVVLGTRDDDALAVLSPGEYVLLPLVADIVPSADGPDRRLVVTPPPGLLDLAYRPAALDWLRPRLAEFCTAMGLTWTVPGAGVAGARSIMPRRSDLETAGRHDLVAGVLAAGGFPEVALALGLRARRRPMGYWEDVGALDEELTWFADANWTVHVDSESRDVYYYNALDGEIRWAVTHPGADPGDTPGLPPPPGGGHEPRRMPTRAFLESAGRYDLHAAIVRHGGYRHVAATLGRAVAPRPPRYTADDLVDALWQFLAEVGGGQVDTAGGDIARATPPPPSMFPTYAVLREAGRGDLVRGLAAHGGASVVAATMGLPTRRRGVHHFHDAATAAAELKAFMTARDCTAGGGGGGVAGTLPTYAELRRAGRHDLRYALQRHGSAAIAQALGMEEALAGRGGRPRQRTPRGSVGQRVAEPPTEEKARAGARRPDR